MSEIPSNGFRLPAHNECILWADKDFNGPSISRFINSDKCTGGPYTYEEGSEATPPSGLDKANNKFSSYACGKDVAFDFCQDSLEDSCRNGKG